MRMPRDLTVAAVHRPDRSDADLTDEVNASNVMLLRVVAPALDACGGASGPPSPLADQLTR